MSVRALVCKDEHAVGGTQLDQHASAFARDWLVMLPHVNQLSLDYWIFDRLLDYIVSEGPRWIRLYFDTLIVEDIFRANTPFINLKKLICSYSPSPDTKFMHLPPQLVHLGFKRLRRTSSPIYNHASSALRFLRTNSSALSDFRDFSKLPHLQHLEITDYDVREPLYSEVTQLISSCQSLVSLGLEVSFSGEIHDFRIGFARLPQTLLRLNFLSSPPLETIIDSVERGPLASIRIIGLPDEYSKKDWAKEYLHILQWLCSSRGIAVEWIKGDSYDTGKFSVTPRSSSVDLAAFSLPCSFVD